jgi:hypothetical protein
MADKKITNEPDTDYRLVGIASSLKEYQVCHHLNQLLGCDFRKLEALVFEPKDRTRKTEFSVFKAEDALKNTFIVFTNKNLGEYLLPEISNFDYIVQIRGKFTGQDIAILMDGIRQFPQVVMCLEVPLKKIKSKERLSYREEHEVQRLMLPKRFKNK